MGMWVTVKWYAGKWIILEKWEEMSGQKWSEWESGILGKWECGGEFENEKVGKVVKVGKGGKMEIVYKVSSWVSGKVEKEGKVEKRESGNESGKMGKSWNVGNQDP